MIVGQKPRPSSLDPFKAYLLRRVSEGCLKATVLHREVTAQGFAGSYGIVRAFVEQHRTRPDLSKVVKPPSVREVTAWFCRHPDRLVERDTGRLRTLLDHCPELATATGLVRWFADMLTNLHGDQLGAWIAATQQAALPGITGFATGLTSDLDAVTAGLTLGEFKRSAPKVAIIGRGHRYCGGTSATGKWARRNGVEPYRGSPRGRG